jgi:uncharacterized protein (DUF2141 family)
MLKRRCNTLFLAAAGIAIAPPAVAADLEVAVTGLNSTSGRVICRLFTPQSGFPTTGALKTVTASIAAGQNSCRFAGIADGTYAVAIAHDANSNGELDRNFIGLPTEGFAFSRNVRPSFGPPSFDSAAVRIGPEGTRLSLRVIYP